MVGKEVALIEAIRCGDTASAIKLITKNTTVVKQQQQSSKQQQQSDQRNMPPTLKSKINVNFQNEQGLTSLHQACISSSSCNNSLDLVCLLLDCGARVDIKDIKGYRAIHFACQNGKPDLVHILLKSGASPNEPTLINSDTPMHLLVQHTPNNVTLQTAYEQTLMILLTQGGVVASSASLTMRNTSLKQTPFEMACELGKTRLVEIFIRYFLSNNEIIRSHSTNSLLLAAKNGHDDIIRLLLVHDLVDLNHTTTMVDGGGSALHEACRYGRYQTVKLLLESGIDTSLQNGHKQTAFDVVIKQKIGNDIKCLIKEFDQSVRAVSVVATNMSPSPHPSLLSFASNELIVVLERPSGGQNMMWRGFILDKSSYTTRSGYFPASHVKLISESTNMTATPFVTSSTSSLSNYSKLCSEMENMSAIDIQQQSSDQTYMSQSQLVSSKTTAATTNTNVLSSFTTGQTTMTINSLSPSSSSTSSCSSFSRGTSSSSAGSKKNVVNHHQASKPRVAGGLITDNQILHDWLSDQSLAEPYYDLFIRAGYDLLTVAKATPADLCALGVNDPVHRARLRQNVSKLVEVEEVEDRLNKLLMYVRSVDDMLKLVGMEEYAARIKSLFGPTSSTTTFEDMVKKMSCEDLEEMGIEKLGHQKKLMLVVKMLKKIQSQKASSMLPPPPPPVRQSTENLSIEQQYQNTSSSSVNMRMNNIVKQQQPPLPPRVSSILMQPRLAHETSNYATLPRNRKSSPTNSIPAMSNYQAIEQDNGSLINKKQSNMQFNYPSSSSVSNPSSPFKCKPRMMMMPPIQQRDNTDSLLLPPPMPIISLAPPAVATVPSQHKIVKRSSPFTPRDSIYSSTSSNLNEETTTTATTKMGNGGVLSDLDSMLCDLNRQLDAMLSVDKFSQVKS